MLTLSEASYRFTFNSFPDSRGDRATKTFAVGAEGLSIPFRIPEKGVAISILSGRGEMRLSIPFRIPATP